MALFLTLWSQNSPYLRLEENFKSKLNIARGAGRDKAPEIRISDASVQTVELSMIPRVEKLSPKLNSHSLCELSVLDEAQVPIINTGTDDPIAAVMGSLVPVLIIGTWASSRTLNSQREWLFNFGLSFSTRGIMLSSTV